MPIKCWNHTVPQKTSWTFWQLQLQIWRESQILYPLQRYTGHKVALYSSVELHERNQQDLQYSQKQERKRSPTPQCEEYSHYARVEGIKINWEAWKCSKRVSPGLDSVWWMHASWERTFPKDQAIWRSMWLEWCTARKTWYVRFDILKEN